MSGERHVLRFVRHGATHANSAGLRCGGDLDLPMTALGHEQAVWQDARYQRLLLNAMRWSIQGSN